MAHHLILASGSKTRQKLLAGAGVSFTVSVAEIDESKVKDELLTQGAELQEIAETLAEAKAMKISGMAKEAYVIGSDQVLAFDGRIFDKPITREDAREQLMQLRGQVHQLLSSVVICHNEKPIWVYTGRVNLAMRDFSDGYLVGYLDRNWPAIQQAVGGYMLEEEGIRLFSEIEGDYFTVLGMPMLALLSYLTQCGELEQ